MLKLPTGLMDEFKSVAAANGRSRQLFLTIAVEAMIRFHNEHGKIPLDMEISQQPISAEMRELIKLVRANFRASDYPEIPDSILKAAEDTHPLKAVVIEAEKAGLKTGPVRRRSSRAPSK